MIDLEKEKDIQITEEEYKKHSEAVSNGKRILENIMRARRAVGNRYAEHQENMAFYEGKQYNLSAYKISRPWVVRMRTPYASTSIDIRVSSLIAEDYRGELMPMAPEDDESVKMLRDFIHDEWERLNLDTLIDHSIKTSAIVREGYVHLVWKDEAYGSGSAKRDGFIEAYTIDNPSSIYIEPTALCLRDARYMAVLNRKSKEEAMEMYPELKKFMENPGAGGWSAIDRGEINLTKDYETEQEDVVTIATYYEKKDGIIHKYVLVEDMLVDEAKLDGLRSFPIAQMRWKRASTSPYGISLMDELIDLQKAVNAIESAITNTAVAYSAPSYIMRKGIGIDPKDVAISSGTPGLVFAVEGNINEAIAPMKIPTLDNAIIGVKTDFITVIDRIAGITNPYLGSIGTSGNTASGAKMALERARIVEADVLGNIETFVEEITNILVDYVVAGYSGEEVTSRKVDMSTHSVEFKKYNLPENLEDIKYSFFINLSKKTAYSKEREKEMVKDMYQMENQYKAEIKLISPLDIIEAYDMPNRDVLVKRFKEMSQKTNENKASIISQLVAQANQLGMPPEQVEQAIIEIISGQEQTPVLDQLQQTMQQVAQSSANKRESALQGFTQGVSEAGVDPSMIQQMVQQMGGE